jgi:protocatechuate 3,4-dioxygenase, alpha subunit
MSKLTPSQTVGPFFGFALPFESDADAVAPGSPGALRIEGQVLDGAGEPVPDALIEVWGDGQFARCGTDSEGTFHLTVRKPGAKSGHAPALNVFVFARGLLRHLATRIYFPDEEDANSTDAALLLVDPPRRRTLIAQDAGVSLRFDVKLQGEDETVFFEI